MPQKEKEINLTKAFAMRLKSLWAKLDNILWTAVVLVWSIPTGFLFLLKTEPRAMVESKLFIASVGGIAMIITLSGTSYLVYCLAKYLGIVKAYRVSLIFYTFFLLFFFVIAYIGTNSGEKRIIRDSFFHTNSSNTSHLF